MSPIFIHRHGSWRAQAGFTLLELLVALTLSVLLLTVLAAALHQVGGDWNRMQGRLDKRLDLALGLLQVERALQGALPHFYRDEDNQALLYFEGDASSLSWVSTVSPNRDPGFVAWYLDGTVGEEDEGVLLRLAPAFTDSPEERLEEAESRVLIPGYAASFQYLEQDPADPEKQEWLDEWSAEERQVLPRGVRVVFETFEEEREPLEVVAAIAAFQHISVRPKVTKGLGQ